MKARGDGIGGGGGDDEPEKYGRGIHPYKFTEGGFGPSHKDEYRSIHAGYEFSKDEDSRRVVFEVVGIKLDFAIILHFPIPAPSESRSAEHFPECIKKYPAREKPRDGGNGELKKRNMVSDDKIE